jgi:hypothetical protein
MLTYESDIYPLGEWLRKIVVPAATLQVLARPRGQRPQLEGVPGLAGSDLLPGGVQEAAAAPPAHRGGGPTYAMIRREYF